MLALGACETADVNEPGPVHDYVAPDFKVPEKMLGNYINSSFNQNDGTVLITEDIIVVDTEIYSVVLPVDNTMYYNNCYIKIILPDGMIMQIWEYDGHEFINIRILDSSLEYPLGRFEHNEVIQN